MGRLAVPSRSLPVVALPSTAGTGAEMTKNSVLTDHQNNVKKSLRSPLMIPKAAVVDPELTLGLPFAVTRDSGLDALTQAIESCVSTGATLQENWVQFLGQEDPLEKGMATHSNMLAWRIP